MRIEKTDLVADSGLSEEVLDQAIAGAVPWRLHRRRSPKPARAATESESQRSARGFACELWAQIDGRFGSSIDLSFLSLG